MMKTYMAKKENIEHKWYIIDAKDKILGRLASEVAKILLGKHKPIFTSHLDTGDYVIIINADKIIVTGRKLKNKVYHRYSGYPGGLKEKNLETLFKQKPTQVLKLAIKGMLPKNPLGRRILSKLKIYAGSTHPHEAQKPELLEV